MFNKNPFAMYRHVDGEDYLILNEKVFILKGISQSVWNKLDFIHTEDDLLKSLHDEYQVDIHILKKDINKLIKNFTKLGLITYE